MRTITTEGIIIKRKNIGEADKILTLFTKQFGKMQVKAPGVRKIASRRSPHVELLNRSLLTIYISGSLPLVTEALMLDNFHMVKVHLEKIGYAYHMCEIIDGLLPENEQNDDVYLLFVSNLKKLCLSETPSVLIRDFEFSLLELLGFSTNTMRKREYFNVHAYIESLLEKKLKSKDIFLHKTTI
jgi:DNA repair protein RecO (recombination protein O)